MAIIALTLALAAVLIAAGVGRLASYAAGQDFLDNPSNFYMKHTILSLLFYESITPIFVIPLTGDKLGICAQSKGELGTDIYLLGRSGDGTFVVVFQTNGEESNGRVVFLSSKDYTTFTAGPLSGPPSFGGCHSQSLYNDSP
jgi:hypothetical protein